ncbi:hypothetical protein [Methanobrevibacter arboriphilus]|uniref:hypothetical protein n=1 Tax=Methanobrevibacter arboriphilus TaxID=39441 RepID=UPI0006D0DF3B|nr:hypothetical protein [Methanobrevibacter arboriphilus]
MKAIKKYFIRSKEEFLSMGLSEVKLRKLPKKYKDIYLNIVKFDSYNEVELLNEIKELENKIKKCTKENNKLKQKINSLKSSKVLKITKPFRKFKKLLKD